MDHGALPGVLSRLSPGARRALGRALRVGGWLAVALALYYVGAQLIAHGPWRLAAERGAPLLVAMGAGMVVYAASGLLLAAAWRELLGPMARAVPALHHQAVYGRSQIAKYLPGNLGHLAGRQLLGHRLGHPQLNLALATLAETASLLVIAALLALPVAWRALPTDWWAPGLLSGLGALALAMILGCAVLRPAWAGWLASGLGRQLAQARPTWSQLLRAGLLHGAFFLIGGALLWWLCAAATGSDRPSLDPVLCAGALAAGWLAGVVTPGASAGLGVREAVLIVLLTDSLGSEASTLAALAFRAVTMGGDALLFALASMLALPARPALRPRGTS